MKKIIVILLITLTIIKIKAQTTDHLISDLRVLISSAKTNFADDMGEKLSENTASKTVFYNTKYATSGAKSLISKKLTGNTYTYIYAILYDLKDADAVSRMIPVTDAYIDELNVMVQSGNYAGRDYKDEDGYDVTEINDKAGNHILDYFSNKEHQNIYIYGLSVNKN